MKKFLTSILIASTAVCLMAVTAYAVPLTAKTWISPEEYGHATFDFGDKAFFEAYVTADEKYYLNMSVKENEEITKAYPEAALTFLSFLGDYDTFSRAGTLYFPEKLFIDGSSGKSMYQSNEPYIYEIIDDELVPLYYKKSAVPNKDISSFAVQTKTLGYYVISDIDLADQE